MQTTVRSRYCRLLEKFLMRFKAATRCPIIKHRLITDHQFGFVPGKSTTHQMLCIVDDWLQAQYDGKGIAAVFMDFQKAFDRVWHDGLLYTLGLCCRLILGKKLPERSVHFCTGTSTPLLTVPSFCRSPSGLPSRTCSVHRLY